MLYDVRMTAKKFFVMLFVYFIMIDHSWAENATKCSQKRFQNLLYNTSAKIMLDKGKIGEKYWRKLSREKETARALCEMSFIHGLYGF